MHPERPVAYSCTVRVQESAQQYYYYKSGTFASSPLYHPSCTHIPCTYDWQSVLFTSTYSLVQTVACNGMAQFRHHGKQ